MAFLFNEGRKRNCASGRHAVNLQGRVCRLTRHGAKNVVSVTKH